MTTRNTLIENVYFPETALENPIRPKLLPVASIPQETPLEERLPGESTQPTHFFLLDELDLKTLQADQQGEPISNCTATAGDLKPLSAQETRSYLERALGGKGWKHDPEIDETVFHIIHQYSEGVPKRINILCNSLLLQSFIDQSRRITGADAIALANELPVEKPISYRRLNEESSVLPPLGEIPPDEPVGMETVPKECPPVEALEPSPPVPSDTPTSTNQRAHFGSRNSASVQNRARRGKW